MRRTTTESTLTPEQFNAALADLGWKQTDSARMTGLSLSAVNRWATGLAPAPLWATAYLGAMLDLAALHRKYLAPPPSSSRPLSAAEEAPEAPPARLAHHLENGDEHENDANEP